MGSGSESKECKPMAPRKAGGNAPGSASRRGRYFTLVQAAREYPVFTVRLLRRLVQQRRIAFSRVGRSIVLAEADLEAYIETNRVEMASPSSGARWHQAR